MFVMAAALGTGIFIGWLLTRDGTLGDGREN